MASISESIPMASISDDSASAAARRVTGRDVKTVTRARRRLTAFTVTRRSYYFVTRRFRHCSHHTQIQIETKAPRRRTGTRVHPRTLLCTHLRAMERIMGVSSGCVAQRWGDDHREVRRRGRGVSQSATNSSSRAIMGMTELGSSRGGRRARSSLERRVRVGPAHLGTHKRLAAPPPALACPNFERMDAALPVWRMSFLRFAVKPLTSCSRACFSTTRISLPPQARS